MHRACVGNGARGCVALLQRTGRRQAAHRYTNTAQEDVAGRQQVVVRALERHQLGLEWRE